MDEDGSEHSGQHDVGCVEITAIIKPVSVIWICSMSIPSGSGSSGVFSMIPSCLAKKQSAFRLLMEETIPRPVHWSFHASEQCGPKVAMSRLTLGFSTTVPLKRVKPKTEMKPQTAARPVTSTHEGRL